MDGRHRVSVTKCSDEVVLEENVRGNFTAYNFAEHGFLSHQSFLAGFYCGRGGEIRTPNTRFWRPVLCRLNYAPPEAFPLPNVAVRTGLEPATPGVTGRYSDQLNYRTFWFLSVSLFAARTLFVLRFVLVPGSVLLSHGESPHYPRRCSVSLLSSAWIQVGPLRSGCQACFFVFRNRPARIKQLRCCKVKSHGSLVPVS